MAPIDVTTRRRGGRPRKLKTSQIDLLLKWMREDPRPTVTEMARRLGEVRRTVSNAVQRLENEGRPETPDDPPTPEGARSSQAGGDSTSERPLDQEKEA